MCGIAGIIECDEEQSVDGHRVSAMMQAMAHRGPDDQGTFFEGPVGLGHLRLSIIDLENGKQPMTNEDGSLWIVFNGEIYNFIELRKDLERHHTFRTQSDTEVILHLYEELGERCLDRLNGMFSFAIWDKRQRRLFAARDRLGIKPFYWVFDGRRFGFASEPKALIAGGLLVPSLNPVGLEEYLTFQYCLDDRTLFQGISRLEPGHYLSYKLFRDKEPSIVRYWDFNYELDSHHTDEFYMEELAGLLNDSVRLQLRSDVPVGSHLSGGIDSSTITCLAAVHAGSGFQVFTGAFGEGPQFDETEYARCVAQYAHAVHHEVRPTANQFVEIMPWLMYIMDEPAAGPGVFPQYVVSKLARDHVRVALGGQGGDELFGGYARYLIAYLEQCLKGVIYGDQEEGKYVVTWDTIMPHLSLLREYQPLLQKFWRTGLFESPDSRYFRLVSRSEDIERYIAREYWSAESQERVFASFQRIFNNPATKSYFLKMTDFDLRTLLPALLHVEDRTSMSVSLESRVPLLDHRIVDLVTRMPPTMRFKGGDTKRVFRDAIKSHVPQKILNRKDKMGFPVPLNIWLKGPLRDFVGDVLLSRTARQRGIYKMEHIEPMMAQETQFGRQIWGLLCLELWCRAFLDYEYCPRYVPDVPVAIMSEGPATSSTDRRAH